MTDWKTLILAEMQTHGETPLDLISNTLTDEEMLMEFDDGFGGTEGKPFTAWSGSRTYFPICYDGAEWVGSVARNPDGKPTDHLGGG